MKFKSCLLCDTVQLPADASILALNSAADPFVQQLLEQASNHTIMLAEDSITYRDAPFNAPSQQTEHMQYTAFHDYIVRYPAETIDVAVMNLLYQPGNTWMYYGLQVALHALRPGGKLYVAGAKDRGILSVAKRMREYFGNVETLLISKGHRVLCAHKTPASTLPILQPLRIFADSKLDEGTSLLLEALEVRSTDDALDIGCGAGFIGLHIARLAEKGQVTMVDVSLAAVAAAQEAAAQSGLANIQVVPSDGARSVLSQRFDLVATNPPFHQGGIQTTEIATRFIREASQVVRPQGRFYLVANRFLKYEPALHSCFTQIEEVSGNERYKVLRATQPLSYNNQEQSDSSRFVD